MNSKIVFIIVAYHPEMEEFGRLLRALPAGETMIVDNGQTLSSGDVGRATLLSQTRNLGYGVAANIGIRHAIARGDEWFVILNQDLMASRDAICNLTKQIGRLDPCVAGPFTGGLDSRRWTAKIPSERVDYISGSCIAIHKKIIEKVGYFYEPYFLYYEEVDYCIRARKKGFASIRLDIDGISHTDSFNRYYLSRNHLLFVERQAPFDVKIHELMRFPKTITEHVLRHESEALCGITHYVMRKFGGVV